MTNSDIIAIASVVVATLAFFSTAWQAWLTHRHSRLSVKPLLTWSTHRNLTDVGFEVISELSNKGLGPAIVFERYFTLNGSYFRSENPEETSIDALTNLLIPIDWNCRIKSQGVPGVGSSILPGDSFRISHLVFSKVVFDFSLELNARMSKVEFVVEYEDIYGKRAIYRTS